MRAERGWEPPQEGQEVEEAFLKGWEGREALPESREGSGGIRSPPRRAKKIKRPSRRAGRGRESLPEGWVVSEGPPGARRHRESHPDGCEGLGGFGRPTWRAVRGRGDRESPQEGWEDWEALQVGQDGLEYPAGVPGGVGSPFRSAGRGWEALPKSQEGSGGPPEEPGGFARLFRRARRCWEALLEGKDGLRGPQGGS